MSDSSRRPRSRTLLLFAAGGLLLPALLLSLLAIKLLDEFTDVTSSIRDEYGNYVAGIATSAVEDAFWEMEQLNMVAAQLDPPENPAEAVQFLNTFLAENPLYRFGFFMSPVGLVHFPKLSPTEPLRHLPGWIRDPVLAALRRYEALPSGVLHLTAPDSLPPTQVTYFTVHSAAGELLGAAGFVWDLDYVRENRAFLNRVLVRELATNPDVFQGSFLQSRATIALLDESGKVFYRTQEDAEPGFIARRSFGRTLPFYQVGIQMSDDRFDRWVRTVVWTNLAMILVMFLVIVLAAAFSLRYILREVELAELKSTFVGNVSHELKTPLALIRLYSETLQLGRAGSPEKEREFLRIINMESERLTHLINNILDMARIEQGMKRYTIAPGNLSRIVRETVDAYEYSLTRDGFTVESEIRDDLDRVPIDGEAMTQAVLNLMDNAIKYSAEERFLRVELERRNGEAVISVQDKGVGISTRDQARIFEKFYRVERGLVHNVKGSGLGLSLVKHIVDAHGGRIEVASKPGKGSRFSIHLPLEAPARRSSDPAGGGDQGETKESA